MLGASIIIGLILVVWLSCGPWKRLNVILITVDTLRADRLSVYGYGRETTPGLEKFASDCVLYRQAFSSIAETLPSHVSIMTGLWPFRHGIRRNCQVIGADMMTMAEYFRDRGYMTAAFVSSFVLDKKFGLDQGFSIYDQTFNDQFLCRPNAERLAESTTNMARRFLRYVSSSDIPFFLWIHYNDPHGEYDPPGRYKTKFVEHNPGRIDGSPKQVLKILRGSLIPEQEEVGYLRDLYDGEISYLDYYLTGFLETVRDLNLLPETVIVITSDHGESLGEHNYYFDHGDSLTDDQLHVPLLIYRPGPGERKEIDFQVRLIDIFPIISSLALGTVPALLMDGENISDPEEEFPVYCETDLSRNRPKSYGVRESGWKLIRGPEGDMQFFNLSADPDELNPVTSPPPDTRKRLLGRLTGYLQDDTLTTPQIDEEARKSLRSLGYF